MSMNFGQNRGTSQLINLFLELRELAMSKRFWIIRGYDGLCKIYERRLPLGCLSEKEITAMMQRLASRHLTENEIVNASLRKNAKAHAPFLNVRRDNMKSQFSIGQNPHYIVFIEKSWYKTQSV